MCIQRCFRNLILKKNVNKSAEINSVETTDSGDSKQKKGKPPDEDAKKATSDTTAHKATFKVKQLLDGEVLKHKLPAKKPQRKH
ncbi:hypothetical protein GCK32_021248 [Trichostrongylus colubriformis]|uniref:Uncharacterized protein n=1 Tax=Trichostrongylus colubriformis TaxID=6319 RepID=A0AAN8IJ72_TRICO